MVESGVKAKVLGGLLSSKGLFRKFVKVKNFCIWLFNKTFEMRKRYSQNEEYML